MCRDRGRGSGVVGGHAVATTILEPSRLLAQGKLFMYGSCTKFQGQITIKSPTMLQLYVFHHGNVSQRGVNAILAKSLYTFGFWQDAVVMPLAKVKILYYKFR